MLYSREELRSHNKEENIVAIQRYIHKIQKSETGKLRPHECDYLAIRLRSIFQDYEGVEKRVFEPYDLPFLSEAVLKYLFILYHENLDFLQPVYDATKKLSANEIHRDQAKFNELLQQWRKKFHSKKSDGLIHEVKLEYFRKLGILNRQRSSGLYGWFLFQRKCLEQELNAFYIYFTVKTFFKNIDSDHLEFRNGNNRFVVTYYSYVHIISRHYIPKLNGIDTEKTFNGTLPFIDPFNLPVSLAQLIENYINLAPKPYSLTKEYMIFNYLGENYIIWWKRKKIKEILNEIGYEIRTLYKIQSLDDLSKIDLTKSMKHHDLIFYY